jgi:outer membrane protein TolC
MRRALGLIILLVAPAAYAQPGQPGQAAQPTQPAPAQPSQPAPELVPVDLTRVEPNGLTADAVGARAAATSFSAKAQEESLRGAAARVDQAWASFLPRLGLTARYTRLSSFTPPSLVTAPAGINSVYTTSPEGPITSTTSGVYLSQPIPNLVFPLVLNNYLLQATVTVPISDYFFRINQAYTAATLARDAARFDAATARAKSGADGRVAYYTWLRMRGAAVVAVLALNDQRTHLNDAKNQFAVGNASRADVLRAETAVAAAELQVERSKNLADLAEKQVRQAMHVQETERIVPGESLDAPPPPFAGNLPTLTQEAWSSRLEIKSIDANAAAAREQATVARNGALPQLSAFGDGILANPNPRKFPQTEEWFPTWDLGAQIVWSPNDVITSKYAGMDTESRAAALEAQRQTVREGVEIEVMQSWQAIKESDVALESTKRGLASAQEAYRVARELFNNGRATSTLLTDAETDLTRARLDALNATVDARIARVRLEHAVGRDARLAR